EVAWMGRSILRSFLTNRFNSSTAPADRIAWSNAWEKVWMPPVVSFKAGSQRCSDNRPEACRSRIVLRSADGHKCCFQPRSSIRIIVSGHDSMAGFSPPNQPFPITKSVAQGSGQSIHVSRAKNQTALALFHQISGAPDMIAYNHGTLQAQRFIDRQTPSLLRSEAWEHKKIACRVGARHLALILE